MERLVKTIGYIGALLLAAGCLRADALAGEGQNFNARNYPGQWTLATNQEGVVTATETAVRRQDDEVFRRVLVLGTVADEPPTGEWLAAALGREPLWPPGSFRSNPDWADDLRHAAREADIRDFIRQYRPPAIPYTSEAAARNTGRKKFNCVEFAEDLVKQARARGIPAETVGIEFKGEKTGHACAGFPTAEGGVLYFDSTPGAGEISHHAHEARVETGEPYRRTDGGELAVAGDRPITKILPDLDRLEQLAGAKPAGTASASSLRVESEGRAPVAGIEYAGPGTLRVSAAQLSSWERATRDFEAVQAGRREIQERVDETAARQAAARALQEDQRLASEGDAFGLLRMGERCLSGDGVAQDPVQARRYLQEAANQGSPTAVEELDGFAGGMTAPGPDRALN